VQKKQRQVPRSLPPAVIIGMAFISGFCIMTIEMLGARIMSPYFGGSQYVWGSIITIFMLALAMGYLFGGRLSTRNPNAVTYALFFIGAAVFSLPIIVFADDIMRPIFLNIEDPRYGSLLASIIMYFVPTSILGMISPYSVRLLVQTSEHSGHMAGQLFFISTIGSAAGTLGTSFYFVLWFDVNQILWGSIAALVFAGSVILLFNYLRNVRVQNSAQPRYENQYEK
jgi:MFS family permease